MKYLVHTVVLIIAVGLASNLQREALGYTPAEYEMMQQAQQELAYGSEHLLEFVNNRLGYSLEDLIEDYSDDEPNLLNAKEMFEQLRDAPGLEEQAIEGLRETVKWLLKGKALLGNDHVVTAYRMRYPSGGGEPPGLDAVIEEFESAVDDYNDGTNYLGDFVQYPEDFNRSNFKEMINVLFRQSSARNEIAERHFALGEGDLSELRNAGQEFRRCAQESYFGAVVLTAVQNESDFQAYDVGRLQTNAIRAANTFKKLASGLSIGGFHRDYIPYLPWKHCDPSRSLSIKADQALIDAEDWYDEAKDLTRQVDEDDQSLTEALEDIEDSVVDELDVLAGPGLTDTYFPNGANLDDPDTIAAFAQAACEGTGDIADAILENDAALASFNAAYTALQNIPKKIEIEQIRVGQIAKVRKGTAVALAALEIAKGIANAYSFSATAELVPPGGSVSVNFNPGSIVTGVCDAEARMLETMQEVKIEGIDSAATIRLYLLDMAEQAQALREYEIRMKQTKLKIDNLYKRLLALVEEWRQSLEALDEAYFCDPAYRLEMEAAVREANIKLQLAQEKCFLAARALSYDWAHEFTGADLGSPYNQFDSSWSVFELNCAQDARTFYDALGEWEGYNLENLGPDSDEQYVYFSLREDILGFTDFDPNLEEENKRLFKQYIKDHTQDFLINFEFSTTIADQSIFPIYITSTSNYWNVKITKIATAFIGSSGWISGDPPNNGLLGLHLGGMSTIRHPLALWTPTDSSGDLLVQYDLEAFGLAVNLRDISLTTFIGDFPDPLPPDPVWYNDGLKRLSVAATSWQLYIDKTKNVHENLNFNELEDIKFIVWFEYGQPPELDCGTGMAEDANSVELIDNEE